MTSPPISSLTLWTWPDAMAATPDVLLLSTNLLSGLAIWGQAPTLVAAGTSGYGVPTEGDEPSSLSGVTILEAPPLRLLTAIVLTSSEARLRKKRDEFRDPCGIPGRPRGYVGGRGNHRDRESLPPRMARRRRGFLVKLSRFPPAGRAPAHPAAPPARPPLDHPRLEPRSRIGVTCGSSAGSRPLEERDVRWPPRLQSRQDRPT